jgi:hypothetical protein
VRSEPSLTVRLCPIRKPLLDTELRHMKPLGEKFTALF